MLTFECMEKIAIASGKGGVGKTSITFLIAKYLVTKGFKVGLLDADIYGPNLTELVDVKDSKISMVDTDKGKKFEPINHDGMQINSIGYVLEKDRAAIWRGHVLSNALKQLYSNTNWTDLDYLLIDMPPGTGDAYLTILNDLDVDKAILVAVEDDFCIADLHRTVTLMNKFKLEILGIVENLSENFQAGEEMLKSERIISEFNLDILFALPRLQREEFYNELKHLNKLKVYFPDNLLIK